MKSKPTMRKRAVRLAVRVVDWEKKVFDRAAGRLGSIQKQADKLVLDAVEKAKWMPKEGKQLVTEWVHVAKKGRHDLRRTVDMSFELTSEFLTRMGERPKVPAAPRHVRAKVVRRAHKKVARPAAAAAM